MSLVGIFPLFTSLDASTGQFELQVCGEVHEDVIQRLKSKVKGIYCHWSQIMK